MPEGPGSWYAGGDFLRRSYGLWCPAVVAGAAAGTGGEPPPPLPLGPAQAAVAAIADPVTLFGHGISHTWTAKIHLSIKDSRKIKYCILLYFIYVAIVRIKTEQNQSKDCVYQ